MLKLVLLFMSTTTVLARPPLCFLPQDVGESCRNGSGIRQEHLHQLMYYYSNLRNGCDPMLFLGCRGNFNRFRTRMDCESHCRRTAPEARDDPSQFLRQDSGRTLNDVFDAPSFETYTSCFRELTPELARDMAQANHRAELHDIIQLRFLTRPGSGGSNTPPEKPSKWPNSVIPYETAPNFDKNERQKLACAIMFFHEKTCIRFVPKTEEHTDYLYLTKDQHGCFSDSIGMKGGRHTVNLDSYHTHCWLHGTIVHELMHAIGFYHEQTRNDRKDYVKIHWDQIAPFLEDEFKTAVDRGLSAHEVGKYDYKSVLHYPRLTNGKRAMTAKKKDVSRNNAAMGNRLAPTSEDARKINILYSCPGTSPEGFKALAPTPKPDRGPAVKDVKDFCTKKKGIWVSSVKSCFVPNKEYKTWFDAMNACKATAPKGLTGKLAAVKNSQVLTKLKQSSIEEHLWLGAKAKVYGSEDFIQGWRYMESVSEIIDKTPYDPRPGVSILLDRTSGDCMIFSKDVWWDYSCHSQLGYICEYSKETKKVQVKTTKKTQLRDTPGRSRNGKKTFVKKSLEDSESDTDTESDTNSDTDSDTLEDETETKDYYSEEETSEELTEESTTSLSETEEEEEEGKGPRVRIVGSVGRVQAYGRVEVFAHGEWGTVCDDDWDDTDAKVACKQLGYKHGRALMPNTQYYKPGSGRIWLDDVKCLGTEEELLKCRHDPLGNHNCGHAEDAGIQCY